MGKARVVSNFKCRHTTFEIFYNDSNEAIVIEIPVSHVYAQSVTIYCS